VVLFLRQVLTVGIMAYWWWY